MVVKKLSSGFKYSTTILERAVNFNPTWGKIWKVGLVYIYGIIFYMPRFILKYRILLFSSSQMWCAVHTESMMRTGIAGTCFLCPFPARLPSHRLLKALWPSQDSCGNKQWEALLIKTPTSIRFLKGAFSACVGELISLRHISYPKSRWQMRKTDPEDLNITEKASIKQTKKA